MNRTELTGSPENQSGYSREGGTPRHQHHAERQNEILTSKNRHHAGSRGHAVNCQRDRFPARPGNSAQVAGSKISATFTYRLDRARSKVHTGITRRCRGRKQNRTARENHPARKARRKGKGAMPVSGTRAGNDRPPGRPRARRPRAAPPRGRTVRFALTDAELADLDDAAARAGLARGAYAARAALAAAGGHENTPGDDRLRELLAELITRPGWPAGSGST